MKKIIQTNKDKIPSLHEKFETVESLLESYASKNIDDKMVLKIMQTQEFCKELE